MTATIFTREQLDAMRRDQLMSLAKTQGHKPSSKITKPELVAMLSEPAEPEAAAEPVSVVALVARFLADPASLSPEETMEVQRWSASVEPEEYDRVMAEAKPPERAPARAEADDEPGEALAGEQRDVIASWRDAAENAEMEVYRPTLLPSMATWKHIVTMANDLSKAVALPEALIRRPADIALTLLAGRDLGLAPTVALNKIHIIKGRPTLAAEIMRGLIIDRGHYMRRSAVTPTSVTMRYRRSDWPEGEFSEVTFTLEDAKTAELITEYNAETGRVTKVPQGKDNWRKNPRAMLTARATSEAGRLDFPDVLAGVSYTPEEMDVETDDAGEPLRVDATFTNTPGQAADAEGEPLSPEEEAKHAGWDSLAAETAAHAALGARVNVLNREQIATAKGMRRSSGWPIRPKSKFDAFSKWVDKAEEVNKAEGKPAEGSPEQAEQAREAVAAAAATDAPPGKPVRREGPSGAEVVESEALGGSDGEVAEGEVVCEVCAQAAATFDEIKHLESCDGPF